MSASDIRGPWRVLLPGVYDIWRGMYRVEIERDGGQQSVQVYGLPESNALEEAQRIAALLNAGEAALSALARFVYDRSDCAWTVAFAVLNEYDPGWREREEARLDGEEADRD